VDATKFPHQFLRPLVNDLRQHNPHSDHQIARRTPHRRGRATTAQPETLARLGTWRDSDRRSAADGRDLCPHAERGLVNRHGYDEMQVVTFTPKQRVRFHRDQDGQVSGATTP
jgi:hypothetical protein